MRKILGLVFLALFVRISLSAQQQHLQGSVQAGKPYVHSLGRGIVLVVTTASIEVHAEPYLPHGHNFAECVTPPYHGPNAIDLDAWLFDPKRNDVSSALHREFQFTLNAADDKAACDELNVVLYSPPIMEKDGTEIFGTPGYKPPPMGSAFINLSKIRLTRPASETDAEIASFSFVADVTLPPIVMTRKR